MARIVFKRGALAKLRDERRVQADLVRRAAAIRDACNAQSSWGGYVSGPASDGSGAQVWAIDPHATVDNARANRLLRALDAGR